MVLSNGSKMARNQQSISNRTNVCGGVKKAGTVPRVGFFLSSNPSLIGAVQTVPKTCVISKTIQTQLYGYHATLGGV
jgi:hypothetical protein